MYIQLGQLRLNPPGLGSKYGKWVERFSDFGKYKGNFRNHTTCLPAYRTLSKWGKWVDRLSDFGKYKGYIRNHSTSLPVYHTLSQVRGGSTSADLAVHQLLCFKKHGPFKTSLIKTEKEFIMHVFLNWWYFIMPWSIPIVRILKSPGTHAEDVVMTL